MFFSRVICMRVILMWIFLVICDLWIFLRLFLENAKSGFSAFKLDVSWETLFSRAFGTNDSGESKR